MYSLDFNKTNTYICQLNTDLEQLKKFIRKHKNKLNKCCTGPVITQCIFFFSPHYFKHIKVSALALLKMVMHARSGCNLEVMGLLLGKVDGNTMIVMDCFALPVEGTETRVNAQAQAYEYMAAYTDAAKQVISFN